MPEVLLEYGDTTMEIEVPKHALVVRPGETYQDPPGVDPYLAARAALRKPLGLPPLRELIKNGDKVVIAFPDLVKGGMHENSHRRVAIPLILEELDRAGVSRRDVKLICAMGLHRKNTVEEFRTYLGDDLVKQFWPHRLVCHDAEDPDGVVSFGVNGLGDVVEFNREAAEADLLILLGHVLSNPYGGYSGGYKMPTTGLTTWRSIRSHHTPGSLHRPDFFPASPHSHFRRQLRAIGEKIEAAIGKKFFEVDAVLGTEAQVLGVYAGAADEVERESWELAQKRTNVYVSQKADILVVGLPSTFHYGPGMGTNPILLLQALGATVVRCSEVLNPGCVIIAASLCNGWFNDEWFPSYREVFSLLQEVDRPSEMTRFEEKVATRPEYIRKYRSAYAYHPFHAFSMVYMGEVALRHANCIFIVGAEQPAYARAMGCVPVSDFSKAFREAEKIVGENPRVLVLPEYFTKAPVQLRYTA